MADIPSVVSPERSAKLNLELVKVLQVQETGIFTPRAVYDGRKNLFSARLLPLGDTDSREVNACHELEFSLN